MSSVASGGLAVLLLFGLLGGVSCRSDDGTPGTAATGQSGSAGVGGYMAGATGLGQAAAAGEDLIAGEGGALTAGAGGMPDVGALAGGAGGMPAAGGSFLCAGPGVASSADGGQAGVAGQTGDQTLPPVSCVTGQSYCYVFAGLSGGGTIYTPECASFSPRDAECATNPTCACLCSHHYACEVECRCKESNGIATLTCHQI